MADESKALIRHCKVELSKARAQEMTDQLVESTNEIERVEDLQKRMAAQQKEIIKREKCRQIEASHTLQNGYEVLPVECREEIDQVARVVRVRRLDTQEVISEQAMLPVRMVKTTPERGSHGE